MGDCDWKRTSEDFWGVRKSCILILVVVIRVFTYVKIHHAVQLRLRHIKDFPKYELFLNKNNIRLIDGVRSQETMVEEAV